MGRRPIPAAIRLVTATRDERGNLTPERFKNKLNPKPGIPSPPDYLTPMAREEWDRIAGPLSRLGVLTEYDRAQLTLYCQAWGRSQEAEKIIARDGLFVKCKTKEAGLKQNPALTIASVAGRECSRYAAELGLTPSARTKIDTTGLNARAARQDEAERDEFFG